MKTIEVVAAVIILEGTLICVHRAEYEREYISLKWLAMEELNQLDMASAAAPV